MTFVQVVGALRQYGADVLLIAIGVTLLTALLKKTFKNRFKKGLVFLPFAIGILLYACFRALTTLSFSPFTTEICDTISGGFSTGCAATLYYNVYEQFFRGKKSSPAEALLEGIVPAAARGEAAEQLFNARTLSDDELLAFCKVTLAAYADPPLSDEEKEVAAETLCAFLKTLR